MNEVDKVENKIIRVQGTLFADKRLHLLPTF